MRGDWLKIWIASDSDSTPRSWALTRPPEVDTWAPNSIASQLMRVRFAPYPTGYLHVGGARTALYNWLLARGQGGEMLLRIEDTDPERSTEENIEVIFDALQWLGIDWDEEPVSQTSRRPRHEEAVEQILDSGAGYLDDGAVRVRVGEGDDIVFQDVVRGEVRNPRSAIKDFVIARSDGSPLYNLAVAVDDHDMAVTHVIRGEDHLSNTARHGLILEALGHGRPVYAHLPLLIGPDGKKLSKRYDAASLQWLREQGYLPEAVINYLALLGWGYDETTTFFTREELIERFSLERVSKNPAVFDEQKLRHINGRYLRELPLDDLTARLEALTGREGLRGAAEISQEKISTLSDFWPIAGFVFDGPADDPTAREKTLGSPEAVERLEQARASLAEVPDPWTEEALETALQSVLERSGAKPRQIYQPIRVALAGTTVSPGIFESLRLLGREESLRRIDAALNHMSTAADTR